MRAHLLSDLHLDVADYTAPQTDADVVILAGDIADGAAGISWARRAFSGPVIYIAGNHEYYNYRGGSLTMAEIQDSLRDRARNSNVHFLENEAIKIGSVRFLCATLWTDFALFGDVEKGMVSARLRLTDFNGAILTNSGYFRPSDALALHQSSRAWLERELAEPWDGITVVVTHFLPSERSITARWTGDPSTTGFASRLEPLIEQADYWIHGHTHESMDYQVGACRVLCNPRGYAKRHTPNTAQNPKFNPELVFSLLRRSSRDASAG